MSILNPFSDAIDYWWNSKSANSSGLINSQGIGRDANLRGDTLDGFRKYICLYLMSLGVPGTDIFYGSGFSSRPAILPSIHRASKNWDVIVVKNSPLNESLPLFSEKAPTQLIAAMEFKSQRGSVGNNQNNRIEESVGSARDFWDTFNSGLFGYQEQCPWIGYLFVGSYTDRELTNPVGVRQPHFPAHYTFNPTTNIGASDFSGYTYAQRYGIFLDYMTKNGFYSSACFISANEDQKSSYPNYTCPFPGLADYHFIDSLRTHITRHYSIA